MKKPFASVAACGIINANTNLSMTRLCNDEARRKALLIRGAATIFDISGTGVFPKAHLWSLGDDLGALRDDFDSIGDDFRIVLHDELEQLKKVSDVRKSP